MFYNTVLYWWRLYVIVMDRYALMGELGDRQKLLEILAAKEERTVPGVFIDYKESLEYGCPVNIFGSKPQNGPDNLIDFMLLRQQDMECTNGYKRAVFGGSLLEFDKLAPNQQVRMVFFYLRPQFKRIFLLPSASEEEEDLCRKFGHACYKLSSITPEEQAIELMSQMG